MAPATQQEYGIHALSVTLKNIPYSVYYEDQKSVTRILPGEFRQVVDLLGLDSGEFRPCTSTRGATARRYRSAQTWRGLINVYFDGYTSTNRDTVCVEIKGAAFEDVQLDWSEDDIRSICKAIAARYDYSPTEFHTYVDDRICTLDFGFLIRLTTDHAYRGHCKSEIHNGRAAGDARSIAFGARPRRISIYESGRHRYSGDSAELRGQDDEFLDYVRVEAQLSDKVAGEALSRFMAGENPGSIALSYVSDAVQFLVPGSDTNKARWKVQAWWSQFTQTAGEIPPRAKRKPATLEGSFDYIVRKVNALCVQHTDAAVLPYLRQLLEEVETRATLDTF